jgi:hypothetical protein
VIGEYLGRIYYESKQRPHFLIKEASGPATMPVTVPLGREVAEHAAEHRGEAALGPFAEQKTS